MVITKQVIVVRRDLNMPPGKLASQVAHAAMAFVSRRIKFQPMFSSGYRCEPIWFDHAEYDWFNESYAKIILAAKDETELEAICVAAEAAKLVVHRIVDEGRTVFSGVPTFTCAGIGPSYNETIDQITGHLPLYR